MIKGSPLRTGGEVRAKPTLRARACLHSHDMPPRVTYPPSKMCENRRTRIQPPSPQIGDPQRSASLSPSDLFLGRFPQNRSQLLDYFIVACECGLIGTTKVELVRILPSAVSRGVVLRKLGGLKPQSCFLEARRAFVILELSANMSKHA